MAAEGPLTDEVGEPAEPPPGRADEVGEQLAGWGTVVRIESRGRRSGRPAAVAVGFIEEPDGSLVVAAGDPNAAWARNLDADPACRVTLGERTWDAVAEPLDAAATARAVTQLILRYGTPAERLGRGPGYRLRPGHRLRPGAT
ncbi:MAG: nitroreductase family deazaflavin-dependent oxidoreductase [Chloroflexi bacterium]|nr:nitroreductase family deazaflavin-dependent oxidoreductase [Chloroflexota bacterium]